MGEVQLSGSRNLKQDERDAVIEIASQYLDKYQKLISSDASLHIHLKLYSREGTQKQYQFLTKLVAPGKPVESSDTNWSMHAALRKTLDNIGTQLERRFM
ncbi:TPA: HPF/RaiA family ribosome-associated protein [Candidatus Woesearchaeota archaeon]|nr:HPF/RaiA family ribosome-associated protein [Candidatus Woesearchaeota archaeon]